MQERISLFDSCYNAFDLDNVRGTAYGFLMAVSDYTSHTQVRVGHEVKQRERHFMQTVMQPAPLLTTAYEILVG